MTRRERSISLRAVVIRHRSWIASALAIVLIAATGCGGGTPKKADTASTTHDPPSTTQTQAVTSLPVDPSAHPEPGGSNQSGGVVARVGSIPITRSALESRMAIEVRSEEAPAILPVPPAFTDCIARLATGGSAAASSTAQLKDRCRERYQTLRNKVLDLLIAAERVIAQAAHEGTNLSDRVVRQRLEHLKAAQFGSEANFQTFLAKSGENIPDLLFNMKQQLASTAVFNNISASTQRATPAVVARFYATHKQEFLVEEQRDLGILRTKTVAAAMRVKHELRAGVSFASIAKSLQKPQPLNSEKGLLVGLKPHFYSEKKLSDAIFSAPLNKLSGPVRLNIFPGAHFPKPTDIQNIDGYYVFEVLEVRPAYMRPLSQVKKSLSETLPRLFHRQATAAFVKRYRASWKVRTDCAKGYVVPKCRQFKPKRGEPAEDPYTLG
jgi:foldase protein PrsA